MQRRKKKKQTQKFHTQPSTICKILKASELVFLSKTTLGATFARSPTASVCHTCCACCFASKKDGEGGLSATALRSRQCFQVLEVES